MYQFILRRLLLSLPTLLIVSFLIFGMIRLNPDSVVAARLGEGYTPEQAEQVKDEYGLNNPMATEYVKWLGRVVRGDWGESAYTSKSVLSEMGPKIGVTFELAFLAVVIAVCIGVPIGVYSAMRQDRWPDYVLRTFAIFGLSVPGFLIATIVLAVLAKQFGWIPPIRYKSLVDSPFENLQQLWMPAFIVSLATAAQVMRFSRTMMLDVLRQDYIRTAWSKGLRERVIIMEHALKNAMLPVITVIGLTMATLIGGTVTFEQIFTIPGLGRHLILAVAQKDFAVVQGVALFFSIAVVTVNLLVDVSYTVLDPRAKG
ncbi:MAG TPA: ABC transporter permease [Tepidiformaceae bacterium]|nr:ABC transporter permease [Tepidiformaceae bacterium]